jgi:hypothetical protein
MAMRVLCVAECCGCIALGILKYAWKAPAMTEFVLFGLPASLVALAWGAAFLHGRSVAREVPPASRPARVETAH